ncbi:hypothetical protein OH76DRAFT_134721 [Lentinus brumalis]|uniref:Uncharacterized protein n=1 Tax=Lentinus brumalis TaxID=2498619 RepID=A0A371DK56_9APHY|nr:hypothetical protein OH76DRAFT_134721 [Polyporus brumalis]
MRRALQVSAAALSLSAPAGSRSRPRLCPPSLLEASSLPSCISHCAASVLRPALARPADSLSPSRPCRNSCPSTALHCSTPPQVFAWVSHYRPSMP